MATRALWWV